MVNGIYTCQAGSNGLQVFPIGILQKQQRSLSQDQMLTLVEYLLLLYRALLPALVWYRFFLNKEYGSLFSSLMTGLYLTFKLTSVVEKVQSFITALKALSRKDIHYGAYATSEQGPTEKEKIDVQGDIAYDIVEFITDAMVYAMEMVSTTHVCCDIRYTPHIVSSCEI
ncbi:hypothetical protein CASFOL_000397 [Castilleja foliolosa]|uniref:Uncharacterized protein n=1 Tax=Castilleja foliolosa TaxID=1961234 RepID=A0ABD3EP55_9LAMI